ncbi:MAG: phosphopentomutase [Nitrospirae bacterium]|nr:phosphopentomutase [Nitrospirota bacterium]
MKMVLIVLDSLGIGELPDAALYNDVGSNTLKHISEAIGGIDLPNMEALGLGYLGDFKGIKKIATPNGAFGIMAEASAGKDSITGHWEMMGLILKESFPTFPDGFPEEIMSAIKDTIGIETLGNYAASGTEIINDLGEAHMSTGYPIIYTSVDSVFQIAAHEDIIPVDRLYRFCEISRHLLTGVYGVARVIARPFIGEPGNFQRTSRRRDFSLPPPELTLLDSLKDKGIPTIGIGKIGDIFSRRGVGEVIHTTSNEDGIDKTIRAIYNIERGLIFTNLIDFDMLYGHRNDVKGYADALKAFDRRLPEVFNALKEHDILIITADHGCDPTTVSTDHSREYVPLLIYGDNIKKGINVGVRKTFADLGQTIAEIFQLKPLKNGNSFLSSL